MSRKPRRESPTDIYHVIMRGINQENIFPKDSNKRYILRLLKESRDSFSIEIYAYCVMDNHIHLLLRAGLSEMSGYIQKVASAYAVFYNYKQGGRVGYVFQDRFKSECIDSEKYFWNCLQYIHLNPVKAGICSDIFDYPYSSAKEYNSQKVSLLNTKAIMLFQKNFEHIQAFHKMHEIFHTTSFEDIKEESLYHRQEVLFYITQKIQKKYNLSDPLIVYHAPKFRSELKRELKGCLSISNSKIDKLVDWGRRIFENPPSPIKELV